MHMIKFNDIWEQKLFPLLIVRGWKYRRGGENIVTIFSPWGEDIVGVKISSHTGTQDRVSWRSSVKNSRQEPTPSNESAPQSMAAPQARRVLGMCTRSFNKTGFDWLIVILI